MIELSVDKQVLAALRRAFPQPAGRADRALNRYTHALREMLIASLARGQTPMETKGSTDQIGFVISFTEARVLSPGFWPIFLKSRSSTR